VCTKHKCVRDIGRHSRLRVYLLYTWIGSIESSYPMYLLDLYSDVLATRGAIPGLLNTKPRASTAITRSTISHSELIHYTAASANLHLLFPTTRLAL
jgi:hypothetical protein